MKKKIKAPAKINLTLEVIKKLPNGFHQLRSVVWKLDNLFDEVTVEINSRWQGIKIKTRDLTIPRNEENICYKAAANYLAKIKSTVGIIIEIKKNIPVAAGLGGGSSDAAAVLMMLNSYYKNKLSQKELINLAAEIGKDIPLFLYPEKTLVMEGMGEKIEVLSGRRPKLFLLIVNPRKIVSTKEAYERLSPRVKALAQKKRINWTKRMKQAMLLGKVEGISSNVYNDFQLVIEEIHPIIREVREQLLMAGAIGTLMSGSGSTVFGIFSSKEKMRKGEKKIKKIYSQFIVKEG